MARRFPAARQPPCTTTDQSFVTSSLPCRWCGAPSGDGTPLPGRIRCPGCGVATTEPWPTEAALDRAYEGAYRPGSGRFAGIGDRVLRWTRGSLSARIDSIAPDGPVLDVGAGRRVRWRRRCDAAAGGRRDDRAGGRWARFHGGYPADTWAAIVFWHSLEDIYQTPRRSYPMLRPAWRPMASWSSPSPTPTASRHEPSALAGSPSTRRATSST